jgi:hypothetical protein
MITSFTLAINMKFTSATINSINHLPWLHGAPTDGVGDEPRENPNHANPLDGPRHEPAADYHGSFDSVASSYSTVSSKSDDSFATALEEAEDAHRTAEKADKYLKNIPQDP